MIVLVSIVVRSIVRWRIEMITIVVNRVGSVSDIITTTGYPRKIRDTWLKMKFILLWVTIINHISSLTLMTGDR